MVYILSDIHGCYKTLLALVAQLPADAKLVFAGDLVDRGGSSKEVVDFVINGGYPCVLGNHEDLMVKWADNEIDFDDWGMNGGGNTLVSYGMLKSKGYVTFPIQQTEEFKVHVEWMRNLPKYLEFPELTKGGRMLMVSHAGLHEYDINPYGDWIPASYKVTRDRLSENADIFWHRDPIHDFDEVYQVIGHTPQKHGPRVEMHYANVDTGAVFNDRSDYGQLTAIEFPSLTCYSQNNCED